MNEPDTILALLKGAPSRQELVAADDWSQYVMAAGSAE